jgi:hypothetical protein
LFWRRLNLKWLGKFTSRSSGSLSAKRFTNHSAVCPKTYDSESNSHFFLKSAEASLLQTSARPIGQSLVASLNARDDGTAWLRASSSRARQIMGALRKGEGPKSGLGTSNLGRQMSSRRNMADGFYEQPIDSQSSRYNTHRNSVVYSCRWPSTPPNLTWTI